MNEFKSKTNLDKLMQIQAKFFKPFIQELMTDDRMDQADFERKEKKENSHDHTGLIGKDIPYPF